VGGLLAQVSIALFGSQVDGGQLFAEFIKGGHRSVPCPCLITVDETSFGNLLQRRDINVKTQMREKSRAHTPEGFLLVVFLCFFILLLELFVHITACLRVNHLVETGKDVTTSHPFEHFTSLHQYTPFRHLANDLGPVAHPNEKAGVTRLSMTRDKVKIVMEASESCADAVLSKIATSRSQQMGTLLHALRESVLTQAHADSAHAANNFRGGDHVIAPGVHLLFPFGELFRNCFGKIILHFAISFANRPEESPFSVMSWRVR